MKGNISINKTFAKGIENGKIVQILPEIQFEGRMVPLFTSTLICSKPLLHNLLESGSINI